MKADATKAKAQCSIKPWTWAASLLQALAGPAGSESSLGQQPKGHKQWDSLNIPLSAHTVGKCQLNTAGQSPHTEHITHQWKVISLLSYSINKTSGFDCR